MGQGLQAKIYGAETNGGSDPAGGGGGTSREEESALDPSLSECGPRSSSMGISSPGSLLQMQHLRPHPQGLLFLHSN